MTERLTALVTGANRGLGRAVAQRLRDNGFRVVVGARDRARAAAVADPMGATPVRIDVTEERSVLAAREEIGPVDVLVNNAGILADGGRSPLSIPMSSVREHLAVNTVGAWLVSQVFVADMVAAGWGRVVMVSSGTGAFSNGLFTGAPAYALSKAGLNGVTQLLAAATLGTGVLVNAVNPGLVRTRMRPDAPRTAQEAARDIVHAATLPDDGPTGLFLRGERRLDW